jgi:hypothetical protein
MENKTSKYFKYAIGEIVLVVIGILIALQINNWNNNRIEASKEQLFLKNLQSDLQTNLIEFDRVYVASSGAYLANNELLEIIKSEEIIIDKQKIDSLFYKTINTFFSLDLIEGSINEIINTGSLNVIKDAKLRKQLSNWSQVISDYKDDLEITNNFLFGNLIPSLENKILLRNLGIPENLIKSTGLKNITSSNFEIDYNKTLKTIEFENNLSYNALNYMFTLNAYKITEAYLIELLALIESNIKN